MMMSARRLGILLWMNNSTKPIVPPIIKSTLKSISPKNLSKGKIPAIININAVPRAMYGRYLPKTSIPTYITAKRIIAGTIVNFSSEFVFYTLVIIAQVDCFVYGTMTKKQRFAINFAIFCAKSARLSQKSMQMCILQNLLMVVCGGEVARFAQWASCCVCCGVVVFFKSVQNISSREILANLYANKKSAKIFQGGIYTDLHLWYNVIGKRAISF